jgi:hypothetical protein
VLDIEHSEYRYSMEIFSRAPWLCMFVCIKKSCNVQLVCIVCGFVELGKLFGKTSTLSPYILSGMEYARYKKSMSGHTV